MFSRSTFRHLTILELEECYQYSETLTWLPWSKAGALFCSPLITLLATASTSLSVCFITYWCFHRLPYNVGRLETIRECIWRHCRCINTSESDTRILRCPSRTIVFFRVPLIVQSTTVHWLVKFNALRDYVRLLASFIDVSSNHIGILRNAF